MTLRLYPEPRGRAALSAGTPGVRLLRPESEPLSAEEHFEADRRAVGRPTSGPAVEA